MKTRRFCTYPRGTLGEPPGNPRGTPGEPPGHPQILQNTQNHVTDTKLPQMRKMFTESVKMLWFVAIVSHLVHYLQFCMNQHAKATCATD